MLQVNQFILIPLLPFVELMHDILIEPEGRDQLAFLI